MNERRWVWLALLVSLLALALAAWSSLRVFEGLPHLEDEFANLWQAKVMAEGQISLDSPAEPKSLLVPFVVDYQGQRFGKYPPGWPALLSLAVRVNAIAWLNPLLAGLSVWLTFRLAQRWLPSGLALLAAGLLAISPMALMLSGSLMSHSFSLFLSLAFSLSWLALFDARADQPMAPWLLALAAGASLGLLVLTRPLTAAGVAFPFAIHGLTVLIKTKPQWRWLILVAGVTLALASLLLLWQYVLTGQASRNLYTLWWDYDRIGFGPEIGTLEGGHNLQQAWINTRFSLRAGTHDLFGWPYVSWLFLPFGLWALRKKNLVWPVIAIIPSIILAYGFYWIGSWLLGPRYYFEAVPAAAIVSAAGIGWLGGWLANSNGSRWRRTSVFTLLSLLIFSNLLFYIPIRVGGMHGLYGIDKDSLQAIEQLDLKRSLIIVHADHWSAYANLLLLRPPFADSSIVLAWSRGREPDRRVAQLYPDYHLYHYFDDQPGVLQKVNR